MDALVRKILEPCFEALIEDLNDEQPMEDFEVSDYVEEAYYE
jgi:hypothetical protein